MMKKIVFIIITFLTNTNIVFGQIASEINLTNNSAEDRYASYSPTGEQIVFESNRDGSWGIYIMDSDGNNQRRLLASEFEDRRPSWHPNGKKIIFESNRSGKNELYVHYINSGKIKKIDIQDVDGEPAFARYSPNGKKIAFTLKKSNQEYNIAIIDRKGTSIKLITNYTFRSFYPNWSADGKTLLFSSRHETNNEDDEIYRINIDGSGKERLTNWPKHNFCARWSNDGRKIAYVTSMENNRPEIYIMDANGENQVRITNNNEGDTLPNWSLDNKKILTTSQRNGNYEICEITIPQIEK